VYKAVVGDVVQWRCMMTSQMRSSDAASAADMPPRRVCVCVCVWRDDFRPVGLIQFEALCDATARTDGECISPAVASAIRQTLSESTEFTSIDHAGARPRTRFIHALLIDTVTRTYLSVALRDAAVRRPASWFLGFAVWWYGCCQIKK